MNLRTLKIFLISMAMTSASIGLADSGSKSGIAIEHIDAAAYSYIKVQSETGEEWIAILKQDVNEGDLVQYSGGLAMIDFYSKTLDRTFESILFVTNASLTQDANSGSIEGKHPTTSNHPASQSIAPAITEFVPLKSGLDIQTILNRSSELKGQEVSLRGQVMKFSKAIMGKNWVTLQDGSGISPDDKLIATTHETVAIGDTVVVSGIIATDVSLGYGYDYKVLLEEATFSN